ncbi:hypothetical protein ASPVEDRAFT_402199 [Aspergillus versicolor CBS 583.65]|uniref:2EXR domain-containing protein n=1 Tax=Aspergillus versicolor CBS 583.65 TaxID=1036611 RepID=A0A1L9Q423_ASPVE|nr:uncharacterized protein ASPVEDRAFT_402199 [Aspergillus versicolor CBS 583.65]OJJ08514.1 hypothetical protein ASPVEDRAFT_402199 [Aspergillus versicolor CBS 583.65]
MPATNIHRLRRFLLFPQLPVELQDHIWDIAAQPFGSHGQLHTFFAADHYCKQETEALRVGSDPLRFGPRGTVKERSFNLLVPWDDEDGHVNTSAYNAICGLWTACRASRKALERRHPRNEWWSDIPGPESNCPTRNAGPGGYLNDPDASHTASYIDREERAQHITIWPERDIVHIAIPRGRDLADWFYHYAGDHVPLLDKRSDAGDSEAHPSFVGMNVAIDYNPRWFSWPPAYLADTLEVFHDNTLRKVWFIDRRLRQRQPVRDWPGDLQTFYSCGYVFTEVRENQQNLWVMQGGSLGASVFDFFSLLAREHGRVVIEGSTRVGVLACEPDPKW